MLISLWFLIFCRKLSIKEIKFRSLFKLKSVKIYICFFSSKMEIIKVLVYVIYVLIKIVFGI